MYMEHYFNWFIMSSNERKEQESKPPTSLEAPKSTNLKQTKDVESKTDTKYGKDISFELHNYELLAEVK